MVFLDNCDRIQDFTYEEVEILNKKHNENEVYELFLDAMAEGIYQAKIDSLKLDLIYLPIEEEYIELSFWNNLKPYFKEIIKWKSYMEAYNEAAVPMIFKDEI